jgi:PLP dependent protein
VEQRLEAVRARIASACERSGRHPGQVTVVAVTKTVAVEALREAFDAGVRDFAENYARELAEKAPQVPARWHFIGKLQRGTAARVADLADVIHSGEPGEGLRRVARRALDAGRRLECLVQVDFSGRRQGVVPEDLEAALGEAGRLPGVRLVGLMTIPPRTPSPEGARPYFRRLRELRDDLEKGLPELKELSMGMSFDYEVAVEEGATMVRVGAVVFGKRPAERVETHPEARGSG